MDADKKLRMNTHYRFIMLKRMSGKQLMAFNHFANKCTAITNKGSQCKNPAMVDSDLCFQHNDNVTRPVEEQKLDNNPWRYDGPGALKLQAENEYRTMLFVLEAIENDFDLNQSSDQMQAQMVAFYFVKWMQAAQDGLPELAVSYDKLIRKSLSCLKATRDKRDGIELKITTPAVWAAKLLGECQRREKDNTDINNDNKNIEDMGNNKIKSGDSDRNSEDSNEAVTKKNINIDNETPVTEKNLNEDLGYEQWDKNLVDKKRRLGP